MPELPDVEGFRRIVDLHAVGHRVDNFEVLDAGVLRNTTASDATRLLTGRACTGTGRTGKWLQIHLDGPSVVVHFGMTGSLVWSEATTRHPHDRVVFSFEGGELRYRDLRKLRGLWLVPDGGGIVDVSGPLGPDVLGLPLASLRERLVGRRAIKVLLMDQATLAGLGNMSSDEVLWRSRIHPARSASTLDAGDVARLHSAMTTMLRAAVRAGHIPRSSRWLASQRDQPEPHCPRCGAGLQRTRVGGRTSIWCPRCQVPNAR